MKVKSVKMIKQRMGYTVLIKFKNDSSKVMKYGIFNVTPYNKVDDPEDETKGLRFIGPIKKHKTIIATFDGLWLTNDVIKKVKLESAKAIYMDGSEEEGEIK